MVEDSAGSADTRQRIIAATIAVIESGGEAAVRLATIAESVGIKQPSIYHFFAGRDDLIDAAYAERYRRDYLEVLSPFAASVEGAASRDDFVAAVRESFARIYAPGRHGARASRIRILGAAQSRPSLAAALREMNRDLIERLGAIFSVAQSRGWIASGISPSMLAAWAFGQILGRVLVEMDEEEFDLDAWNHVSVSAFLAVISPTTSE